MLKVNRQSVIFSLNSFAAAMLALYFALALDLPRPYWAMMSVYIVSNPLSGAVRSKAVYRIVGTLTGAAAMVILVPNLDTAPMVLCLALSLWVAGCLFVSLLDRTPRSYMTLLAGYTAALIGFPSVEHPDAVFDIAVSRVEEIGIGILCATMMHSLVFPQPVGDVVRTRLSKWMQTADLWLLDVLGSDGAAGSDGARRQLAASASDIAILGTHLPFDTSRLRDTTGTVQAMHQRMLLLIPLVSGVADRRQALLESGGIPEAARVRLAETVSWVRSGAPYTAGVALANSVRESATAGAGGGWVDLLVESLLVRLSETVTALGEGHALLDHLHDPDSAAPARVAAAMTGPISNPLHADVGLAFRSGVTCVVALMITCAIWIGTGWPDGATAASMAAVFCALFASLDDPAPAILYFGLVSLVMLTLGTIYVFAIFPAIDGFPLLATALFVPLFLSGLVMGDPNYTIRGMPLAVTFGSALALQETAATDFAPFMNSNLGVYVGMFIALFVTRAMRSMTADGSVRRLLRLTRTAIARVPSQRGATAPVPFAAVLVDRLALLTPRLELSEAGGDGVACEALRDLRVAMNMMALQAARPQLCGRDRVRVDTLMEGLAAYYARLARRGAPGACETLLPQLDTALAGLAGETAAASRDAALSLVGVRRNLFPAAAAFAGAQERTA